MIPLGYLKKFDYPGTDAAYLLVFFGSNQSLVSHDYFPLQILILSKVYTDYGIVSTSGPYSQLTKSNSLDNCETTSASNSKYIDTFSDTGKRCVIQKLGEELDDVKLQSIINEVTTVFSLKQ